MPGAGKEAGGRGAIVGDDKEGKKEEEICRYEMKQKERRSAQVLIKRAVRVPKESSYLDGNLMTKRSPPDTHPLPTKLD